MIWHLFLTTIEVLWVLDIQKFKLPYPKNFRSQNQKYSFFQLCWVQTSVICAQIASVTSKLKFGVPKVLVWSGKKEKTIFQKSNFGPDWKIDLYSVPSVTPTHVFEYIVEIEILPFGKLNFWVIKNQIIDFYVRRIWHLFCQVDVSDIFLRIWSYKHLIRNFWQSNFETYFIIILHVYVANHQNIISKSKEIIFPNDIIFQKETVFQ